MNEKSNDKKNHFIEKGKFNKFKPINQKITQSQKNIHVVLNYFVSVAYVVTAIMKKMKNLFISKNGEIIYQKKIKTKIQLIHLKF